MKRVKLNYKTTLLLVLFNITILFSCQESEDEKVDTLLELEIPEEEEETPAQDTRTRNETNSLGIPRPLTLHYMHHKSLPSSEFNDASPRYIEQENSTQIFKFFKDDEVTAASSPDRTGYIRVEAEEGITFTRNDGWHTFEARMKISGTFTQSVTIAQLFGGRPHMRIEIRSDGKINIGSIVANAASGNNTNMNISDNVSYINKSFKIKIRSNGKQIEVYFNNTKKWSGETHYINTSSEASRRYHFRWGIYYNYPAEKDLTNTCTEVLRYKD